MKRPGTELTLRSRSHFALTTRSKKQSTGIEICAFDWYKNTAKKLAFISENRYNI